MVEARALTGTNMFQTTHIINWEMVVRTHTQGSAQEESQHILQPSPKSLSLFLTQFLKPKRFCTWKEAVTLLKHTDNYPAKQLSYGMNSNNQIIH